MPEFNGFPERWKQGGFPMATELKQILNDLYLKLEQLKGHL